ncbi:hypothetical protein MARPO_0003s0109 [Marchantia polymorpha]|uniref:Uncharacterized protein n=1 Tax=Marchantia polymorpha TaxID=3197 RepID=A0A2R6XT14_MARPO|nr:hypothetical protein MARPO_0003s0109 [Marchantia polymorpha]|eukprot:PTQ49217.1 hypothetical protein MARPO_0003s0109 [Marchantia polymorpha]
MGHVRTRRWEETAFDEAVQRLETDGHHLVLRFRHSIHLGSPHENVLRNTIIISVTPLFPLPSIQYHHPLLRPFLLLLHRQRLFFHRHHHIFRCLAPELSRLRDTTTVTSTLLLPFGFGLWPLQLLGLEGIF